jgi:hypothetical protein
MTIINEERLTVTTTKRLSFSDLKQEVLEAIKGDERLNYVDHEKKRFAKAGVGYSEFKDLVATVGLKPVTRNGRFDRPSTSQFDDTHEQ